MEKEWWKSKTLWAAIFVFVFTLIRLYAPTIPEPIWQAIYGILASVGLVGLRQAVGNIEANKK